MSRSFEGVEVHIHYDPLGRKHIMHWVEPDGTIVDRDIHDRELALLAPKPTPPAQFVSSLSTGPFEKMAPAASAQPPLPDPNALEGFSTKNAQQPPSAKSVTMHKPGEPPQEI